VDENRQSFDLPPDVLEVFRRFFTAELTTTGKDGMPVTWPITVRFLEDHQQFLLTTSIGMPGKLFNIRRVNRVSLSFTEPHGSGLIDPPHVVVQGHATIDETLRTSVDGLEDYWRETIFARQPASKMISDSALMRWLMDWYYIRYVITVDPVRISWWQNGDYSNDLRSIAVAEEVSGNVG
jgi:hypothetical protein